MLVRGAGEMREEEAADESLEDFRSGAEEGDGAIRRAKINGFVRFKDREDKGMFPYSG